jgi:hypothetical protein
MNDNFRDYYDTIKDIMAEPSPCDNCSHFKKCGEEEIACRLFGLYVVRGRFPNDYEPVFRHPTKETYDDIFKNTEKFEKQLRKEMREAKEDEANENNNGGL